MNNTKKKFLFLYLRTGGGHLAPAKSIADFIDKYRSEYAETVLFDGFERSKRIIKIVVVDGYRVLQNKAKWIYELIYAIHKIKLVAICESRLLSMFIEKHLQKEIELVKPDKIVIFHFFMIEPTYRILKRKDLIIPVITVVTDPFTPPPLWFLNKKQRFIVFSEKLKSRCILMGIDSSRIKTLPFPLHEKFSSLPTEQQILNYKREFGFGSQKILLILGGGDGIPKGISILKNLCRHETDYKIVFVCGNNKDLYNQIVKMKRKFGYEFLYVLGFTDNIYELISISDAVITKCGASTIMEILVSNKTPIVNSYIWEQEKGNVEYLIENDLGVYEKRLNKLRLLVEEIFTKSLFDKKKASLIKNGTSEVASYLCEY